MASIQKRENGRWRARYRDASGREHARHFPRKIDAERWLRDQQTRLDRGEWTDPARSRVTVGTWAEQWMETRAHLKPKTLSSYRSLLRTRVLPTWATVPLSKVAYSDVVAWVASMRAEGLSASRTRQAYHLLTSMLDDAVKDSRLPRNPAAGVDLPRLPSSERRYLTHEQVDALADAAGPYRVLVLVLAYCGLRWGEVAALRVGRVDLMRGRIAVVEAVADVDGELVVGTPKSHQRRSVPVPRFLRDDLAEQMVGKGRDDLVFTSPRGDMLRVQNFRRRYFDRAAAEAGVEGLVPHELRHTAASLAVSAGANVKAVQRMLGHASAAMTLDVYADLFDDELDAVADRMDDHRADSLRTNRGLGTVSTLSREA